MNWPVAIGTTVALWILTPMQATTARAYACQVAAIVAGVCAGLAMGAR